MEVNFLQTIWFMLILVLLIVYTILDGFDLGIAMLEPFLAKSYDETRVLYRSIGPVWDGIEVWLLTAGGALFVAFPPAYATIFSGFYMALMLVLFALIFRAVSLEFWLHDDEKRKNIWKKTFALGSLIPSLLFGVAVANLIQGLPLNSNLDYEGGLVGLLRPFPLIAGVLGLCFFLKHGALFAAMKSENDLNKRAMKIGKIFSVLASTLLLISVLSFYIFVPIAIKTNAAIFLFLSFLVALIEYFFITKFKACKAFYSSAISILLLWVAIGFQNFPYIIPPTLNSEEGLFIGKISSSDLTLTVMLIIAGIGVPIVLYYTYYVYRVFKGKTKLT